MPMTNASKEIAYFLAEKNIGYIRYSHKPIFTVEDGKEIAEHLGIKPCKTLLLVNRQHQYYMLVTTGDKRVSLSDFAGQIGSSRLSFASTESLEALLQTTPGAVSPLGLIFDYNHMVGLFIDNDVLQQNFIALHPCVNNESFVFKTTDFINLFLPSVNRKTYKTV